VKLKIPLLMAMAACALFAFTAPALANYRVEKGATGEGKGVFTAAEKNEVKCLKVVLTPRNGPGEVTELQVRVKYTECSIKTLLGTKKAVVEPKEVKYRLNLGKETSKGVWEVTAEVKSTVVIEVSELGCTITNEAGQKRPLTWTNTSEKESTVKVNSEGLKYEGKGCGLGGISNGKHEDGKLKEEVTVKGVKH